MRNQNKVVDIATGAVAVIAAGVFALACSNAYSDWTRINSAPEPTLVMPERTVCDDRYPDLCITFPEIDMGVTQSQADTMLADMCKQSPNASYCKPD